MGLPTYLTDRVPLGIVDTHMWAREKKSGKTCKSRKEGQRWIDGYEAVAARAQALSATRQVYPAAREADFIADAGAGGRVGVRGKLRHPLLPQPCIAGR